VVHADWKEVGYNAVKCNYTITYFTSLPDALVRRKMLVFAKFYWKKVVSLQQFLNLWG
jgi:hypothetical protein